jgi:hypothetical protein
VVLVCLSGSSATGQIPFDLIDSTTQVGISHTYFDISLVHGIDFYGVAAADYDNDGLIDLYLPDNAGFPSSLYKNMGNGSFMDVAVAAGVADASTAASDALFLDYDNDGDLDLFVFAHFGQPLAPVGGAQFKLFRNKGAAGGFTFHDVTADAGFVLTPPVAFAWAGGACAADYDKDGYLDVFVALNLSEARWKLLHSEPNPVPGDSSDPTYTPRIFVDTTLAAGLIPPAEPNPGESWMPTFVDIDRDGYPELHQNVDFDLDHLWKNNGDGTFTDIATAAGMNGAPVAERNEMGAALGDFDGDLDLDFHLTNVSQANEFQDRFYRNDTFNGQISFVDIGVETGLDNSAFGWGTSFVDLDNDGDLDHISVNGFTHDPTKFYVNRVHENLFPRLDAATGEIAWRDVSTLCPDFFGTGFGDDARGMTTLDFDNDGDIDVVATRNQDATAFYENTLVSNNGWLEVDLVAAGGSLNTVGSRVFLHARGRTQYREMITGSSFLSQESPRMHFGIGPLQQDPPLSGSSQKSSQSPPAPTPIGGAGSVTPGTGGDLLGGSGGEWLIVYWQNDEYQLVKNPGSNQIITVNQDSNNAAGDLNGDGRLTPKDYSMLQLLVANRSMFERRYPDSPGVILGDVNADAMLNSADLVAWQSLP